MGKKFEAFIIYETSTGHDIALHLKNALEGKCKINCFVAPEDITPGEDEKEVRYSALKNSEEIFLIITYGTFYSEGAIEEEIQYAINEKKIENIRIYLKSDIDVNSDYAKNFFKNTWLGKKQYFKFEDKSELVDDVMKRILKKEYFSKNSSPGIYLSEEELSIKKVRFWVDGIPKSDDKELKEHYLKALLLCRNEKYEDAIKEFENILRTCIISPTEKM